MFFLYFFLIIVFIVFSLRFSKLQLEIKNFNAILGIKETSLNTDYKVSIRIYILGKIKVLDKQIKKENLKNQKRLKKLQEKLKLQNKKNNSFKVNNLKNIKRAKIKIKKTDLNIKIDTKNAATTAVLTGFFYTIISNFISYFFQAEGNVKYKVEPIYQNKNKISLSFDGIFEINLIHIINTYKVLKGKDKEGEENGTSNTKSYAYNNG